MFLAKDVLKILSKFTGKHPCRSVISIKLLCNFIEITLRHGCSPVNLLHIFKTPFTKNTSGWLLFEVKPHDLHNNYLKSIKLEAAIHRFSAKSYSGKFRKIHGKTSMSMSLLLQLYLTRTPAQVVLLNVKNFFRTSFLQNTSG